LISSKPPHSITINDVAERAGVSISTVSRVINQNLPVSEEVAARVQAAMEELRYVPRAAARSLATRKTHTLGLLLTDIEDDFFAPMLKGIWAVTGKSGFDLLISASGHASLQQEFTRSLGAHNTDGLLAFANSLSEKELMHFHNQGFPLVLMHQSSPASLHIPCVTVENKAASQKIVEHLIEVHGRQRIVLLTGRPGDEDSLWREIGYRKALETHNLPFRPELVAAGDFNRGVAYDSIKQMIAAQIEMDAIFSGDDEAAIGVLAALNELGKRVPEDIAVVGFDDQRLAAYLTPPLTTVRAPTEKVGYKAAQQLIKLIRTGHADGLTVLPTEIVIRRSCGCVP
jgi:LacI family transcriptional regulator